MKLLNYTSVFFFSRVAPDHFHLGGGLLLYDAGRNL